MAVATTTVSFQDLVMSAAVDQRLRSQLRADPERTAQAQGLDPQEVALLRALPWAALERYARALMRKRWREVHRAIPLSLRVCPVLEALYLEFLGAHPSPPNHGPLPPGLHEALRALEPLAAAVKSDPAQCEYAPDLLRFEVYCRCSARDAKPRQLRSRYALHHLTRDLQRGFVPMDPPKAPTRYWIGRDLRWGPA